MGCDNQEDSIDHYAHCRVIRTWAQKRLDLHYDPLNSKHVWTQTLATTPENLHKQAHMIYAAYRATNHFRHAGTHTTSTTQQKLATEYLDQIIHEADKGNYKFSLKTPHGEKPQGTQKKDLQDNPTNPHPNNQKRTNTPTTHQGEKEPKPTTTQHHKQQPPTQPSPLPQHPTHPQQPTPTHHHLHHHNRRHIH
jgi:hypothetical protein